MPSEQEFEELWQQQLKRDREAQAALRDLEKAQRKALEAFKDEVEKQVVLRPLDTAAAQIRELAKMLAEAQQDPVVEKIEAPGLIMIGNNQRAIRAVGVAEGKPFIALITGRGGQYKWERKWVGQRTSRTRTLASGEVELVAGFGSLGTLPAALDIRWGPRAPGGLCLCRGFFRALNASPFFEPISEQQVAFIINQRVAELPDRPVNTPGRRAPINFDEEV